MPLASRYASSHATALHLDIESPESLYYNMPECSVFVQPPARVQCGGPLYPPFLLQLSNAGDGSCQGSYMANITLHTVDNEDVSVALPGPKSAYGFLKPGSRDSYLFAFPESQISTEGEFRLRADIYKVEDGAQLVGQVVSRAIDATGNTVSRATATLEEKEKMEIARQAGALK